MKLFYDNLVPFMPNSSIVDEQRVPDVRLNAARSAMIMLSEFQRLHNLNALYEAVHQISIYANVDIVDLILSSLDEDIKGGTIDELLDIAAKNLFQTISPDFEQESFDYKYFTAIILSVAHTVIVMNDSFEAERMASQQAEVVAGATGSENEPEEVKENAPQA